MQRFSLFLSTKCVILTSFPTCLEFHYFMKLFFLVNQTGYRTRSPVFFSSIWKDFIFLTGYRTRSLPIFSSVWKGLFHIFYFFLVLYGRTYFPNELPNSSLIFFTLNYYVIFQFLVLCERVYFPIADWMMPFRSEGFIICSITSSAGL